MRMMLDSHPSVAVPPESHFVLGLRPRGRFDLESSLDAVLDHRWFRRWRLDPDDVRAAVAVLGPADYPSLVSAVFAAYAASQGASRWVDKTPGYVDHLPRLDRMFPSARVVHVIRDGREVAASLHEREWGPRTVVSGAWWWRRRCRAGMSHGRRLGAGRYLEVRYEQLVTAAESTLRAVCEHLDLEFDAAMLRYHDRAAERLGLTGQEDSRSAVANLRRPPTAGIRQWSAGLPQRDVESVEAVCRPLLAELGYEVGPGPGWRAQLRAVGIRIWDLLVTAPSAITARLRPARRDF